MVGAGELDHDLAAGECPSEAHRAHRRLGAGGGEADHLDRGNPVDDLLGQLDLGGGRGAVAGAAGRGGADGGEHLRVGVAEDQRPPGADPVEVAVAVDVNQLTPLAPLDEDRLPPDLPHGPDRTTDPPRHHLHCSLDTTPRTAETWRTTQL